MAGRRKKRGGDDLSESKTKLSRLLATEDELEAMLRETRREAEALLAGAREDADSRLRDFEAELDAGDGEVRRRIVRERDETIRAIEQRAQQIEERLDGLSEQRVNELAERALAIIAGPSDGGGSK